ncbi:hypothetical protein MMC13_008016 [Lambiella insularis]|nr:hypothetical protein [Lambiella insularis]
MPHQKSKGVRKGSTNSGPVKCSWTMSLKEARAEMEAHFERRRKQRAALQKAQGWKKQAEGRVLTEREAAMLKLKDEQLAELLSFEQQIQGGASVRRRSERLAARLSQ